MAKSVKLQEVATKKLKEYTGNARIHDLGQVERLKASIEEFGFISPCLIDKEYNVIAGHGRIIAAKQLGLETVPCVFIEGLTQTQRRAYIIADNRLSELSRWDVEKLEAELEDLEDSFEIKLTGFDYNFEIGDASFGTQENNDEYEAFIEKFKPKLTTDDCYTPDNIYQVVSDYVSKTFGLSAKKFKRPFYPGGDYQAEKYKKGDVVVDNPPFSILSEIIDFYVERDQPFFLFAPGVSSMGYLTREGVATVLTYSAITYENGADVVSSFVTNLFSDGTKVVIDNEFSQQIKETNKENIKGKEYPSYEFPDEVLTSARGGWLAHHGARLVIKEKDCHFIRALDAMKEKGSGIYGGAVLLSKRAAAERAAAERAAAERAAAERAAAERAAAERRAATRWELSEREREIIKSLG